MQEGHHSGCEFKASLDYVKRPYLNAPNPNERERKALGGERERSCQHTGVKRPAGQYHPSPRLSHKLRVPQAVQDKPPSRFWGPIAPRL